MTPLYCPRCRRPVSGDLEHGVCPLPDRPVEVAPHVYRVFPSDPIPEEFPEEAPDKPNLWRVYSPREEDFGPALTPERLSWAVWRSRLGWWATWAGVSALVAAVVLSALMLRQYGRLLP